MFNFFKKKGKEKNAPTTAVVPPPAPAAAPKPTAAWNKTPAEQAAEWQKMKAEMLQREASLAEARKQNAAKYETFFIKIAGVTFENKDGKSRQAILKKVKKQNETRDNGELEIRKYKYQSKDAIGVYVDDQQVGSFPADQVEFFISNWDRIVDTPKIEVYGGGFKEENGEQLSYGAELTVRLKKNNE